jgi:Cof subfamily protein (haloacid dehalogenase superfamily)
MIKMFVCDIDGTLFEPSVGVPEANITQLLELQRQGICLVLASGRSYGAMIEIAKRLQMDQYDGYLIAGNGAEVLSLKTNSYLHKAHLSVDELHEIVAVSQSLDLHFSCIQDDVLVYTHYDLAIEHEEEHGGLNTRPLLNVFEIQTSSPKCSLNIELEDDPARMALFAEHFKGKIALEWIMPWYMDCASLGQSKLNGVKILADELGLTMDEIAAIGDGENDRTMLEGVGLSATLGNAHASIQAIVKHVVPPVKEAGVARFAQIVLDLRTH